MNQAQSLPFGVGGGLVAIKTLLSRDPCAHANTAIQMIDAILAEHPAHPQQELEYCTDYHCAGDCGQPHNQKEMREFLALQPQQEPVAWAIFTDAGNARMWSTFQPHLQKLADAEGLTITPLYTSPTAQSLPFGVGGGLVAIKTLLSRDPCAHANTTIQMIDSMLAKAALHKGDA